MSAMATYRVNDIHDAEQEPLQKDLEEPHEVEKAVTGTLDSQIAFHCESREDH